MHGLLDKTYVNKLKSSPSYSERSFAKEYLSLWEGGSEETWFNFNKILKLRKIKNPELKKTNYKTNAFYIISVDVGRLNDQTVACIFKVSVDARGRHRSVLVNLQVLAKKAETKTFTQQAIDIKRLIRDFEPREVVIDTNGLNTQALYLAISISKSP